MSAYRFLLLAVSLCWVFLCAGRGNARALAADRPLKILPVGNSLTYTNSLSAPLTSFASAASQPRPWRVIEQAMQNAKLSQMFELGTTEYLLKDEPWDFIVLQEHGAVPTIYPEGLFSAARKFDEVAKTIGAKVILFENWRGNPTKQAKTTEVFAKLGRELGAKVAPVGQAWQLVHEQDPSLQLLESDGVHPSPIGSYVAACAIYMTIADAGACPSVLYGSIDEHVSSVARDASQRAVANTRKAMQSH
jgi:hypothetical protein